MNKNEDAFSTTPILRMQWVLFFNHRATKRSISAY